VPDLPPIDAFEVTSCLEFEADEYRDRWRRLRAQAAGIADAVVVSSPEALRYLCGYRSIITRSKWRPVVLTIPIDEALEPIVSVPAQEVGAIKAFTPLHDLTVANESIVRGHDDPIDKVVEALAGRGLRASTLAIERGFGQRLGMTLDEVEQFRRELPDARFVDAGPALAATRAIKSPAELECLRRACEISGLGVKDGFEQLRAGMTERELHQIMVRSMIERGADEVWLAVGSGAKGYGVFNAIASDLPLRRGDLIWVDGGAYYRGYICDFIRSAVIGEPSADQARWYEAALESNRAALREVRPGIESRELFAAALAWLEAHDMGQAWGLDVLGHGVGLEIHELPSLTKQSTERLQPGHVITIEPSLSPPAHTHGHYIVEEIVAVTESGQELLTSAFGPELAIVDP
jgi:Xaa-Pro aminopeptidase